MNKLKIFIVVLALLIISIGVYVFIKINIAEKSSQTEIIGNDNRENINKDIVIVPVANEYTMDLYKILNSNLLLLLDRDKTDDLTGKFDENILMDGEKEYIKGFLQRSNQLWGNSISRSWDNIKTIYLWQRWRTTDKIKLFL
jgi:hypothetical protein